MIENGCCILLECSEGYFFGGAASFMNLISQSHNYLCLVAYLYFTVKITEVQGLEESFCKENFVLQKIVAPDDTLRLYSFLLLPKENLSTDKNAQDFLHYPYIVFSIEDIAESQSYRK